MNKLALVYAVVAMIAWGFWGIFANYSLNQRSATSVLFMTYAVALGCMAVLNPRIEVHLSSAGLLTAIGAGVTLAFGSLFFYRALSVGDLVVVPAIAGLYFLVSTVYGATVLDETLSTVNVAGIVFACVAIFLLSR